MNPSFVYLHATLCFSLCISIENLIYVLNYYCIHFICTPCMHLIHPCAPLPDEWTKLIRKGGNSKISVGDDKLTFKAESFVRVKAILHFVPFACAGGECIVQFALKCNEGLPLKCQFFVTKYPSSLSSKRNPKKNTSST